MRYPGRGSTGQPIPQCGGTQRRWPRPTEQRPTADADLRPAVSPYQTVSVLAVSEKLDLPFSLVVEDSNPTANAFAEFDTKSVRMDFLLP